MEHHHYIHVLIVEDDELISHSMAHAIAPICERIVVDDGHRTLRRLEAGEGYDVIVLELCLSGTHGIEIYRRIHDLDAVLARRILFVFGSSRTDEQSAFLRDVPNARLERPFRPDMLCALVKAVHRVSSAREAHRHPSLRPADLGTRPFHVIGRGSAG